MATPRESAVLTLAAIRTGRNKPTEVLFNERQSIFTPAPALAAEALPLLRQALDRDKPVKATIDTKSGLIHRVAEPPARELEEFARTRVPLDKPQKVVPIDVARIDHNTFNIVDQYLKWPVFRLCTQIVPSYAKAKEIFDFCAALSCNLPGPFAVPPCIPFQYVRDGCYARAHQMRRIITTRYKYCCEKVFSFANQDGNTLAVKADKWGGCCVNWWYHVAPLIRVRVNLKVPVRPPGSGTLSLTLAMVIDPGMFDQPVTLSTWLAAQQNTGCSPNAHVSMYSIQPGTAYWPTNYAGTTFATDPTYALTEGTLVNYSGLTTC